LVLYFLSWLVSSLFILIKGEMLDRLTSVNIDIEIVIIITVCLYAYCGETGSGIFALGQGFIMDIFSGGTWGFYTTLYLLIYLLIKFVSRPFDLFSIFGQSVVIFIAVVVKNILMVPILHIFFKSINLSFSNFLFFLISAICSAIVAPFIFYLFNSLVRFPHRAKEEF
jgi:rod shape-determining protein MreD